MTDHPEFPQADPATKYIVDQVSKIEEAQNCTLGYYKNFQKLLSGLQRTNDELSRIHTLLNNVDTKEFQKTQLKVLKEAIDDMNGEINQETQSLLKYADIYRETFELQFSALRRSLNEFNETFKITTETNNKMLKEFIQKQAEMQTEITNFYNAAKALNFIPTWQTVILLCVVATVAFVGGYSIG